MTEFSEDVEGLVQSYIENQHGFLSWLGTTVEEISDGRVVLSVPYDEALTNRPLQGDDDSRPQLHGGVAATLIDTAGGLALRTKLDDPIEGGVATINLNVNYLRRATGDLTVTADVVRAGGTVGVSEIVVESETPDGETHEVATGQGSYRLFRS